MACYNLITQPFIPVSLGVEPPAELSLRETFERAHEIGGIGGGSPLVTPAILRLCLAIMVRAGVPTDAEPWAQAWRTRDIGLDRVLAYLDRTAIRERFDLFDPERPFYQHPGLAREYAVTAARLVHELNSGANGAVFDHTLDADPPALTPAQAARALLTTHCFAAGGLVTNERDRPQDKAADGAPLVRCGVVILQGANLAETLLLNLPSAGPSAHGPNRSNPTTDLPAWERATPPAPADRRPDGPVDLLTWQARRIKLFPDESPDGTVVRYAAVMKGYQFPEVGISFDQEQMVAFQIRPKAVGTQDPKPPVTFRPDRALWRDAEALFQEAEPSPDRAGRARPGTVRALAEERLDRLDPEERPRPTVGVYGLAVDRAKLLLWRNEQLPFPVEYLRNAELMALLSQAINLAETAARDLGAGVSTACARFLAPEGQPDRDRLRSLVDSCDPGRSYWAALDAPFRMMLAGIPAAPRSHLDEWGERVRRAAYAAFDRAIGPIEVTARGVRAATEGRREFAARLHHHLDQFTAVLPPEETS